MNKHGADSLNIAFASNNGSDMDAHFGSCQRLAIYRVTPESSEHINTVAFLPAAQGHNLQKINERLAALGECFAVYCLACGTPVRKQLLTQGTRVVVQSQATAIENILPQIQANWPGKIALRQERQLSKKQDADYFSKLAESEWE